MSKVSEGFLFGVGATIAFHIIGAGLTFAFYMGFTLLNMLSGGVVSM